MGREEGKEWGKGREGRGGPEGENDLTHPLSQIPGYATDLLLLLFYYESLFYYC